MKDNASGGKGSSESLEIKWVHSMGDKYATVIDKPVRPSSSVTPIGDGKATASTDSA